MNTRDLSEKVFAALRGNNFTVRMYDLSGAETNDPGEATRFFVSKPNLMITIDQDKGAIELNRGTKSQVSGLTRIHQSLKRLAREFLVNYNTRVFGQYIQPKNFSPGASSVDSLLEYNDMNKIVGQGQVNSYLIGKVTNCLDYRTPKSADDIQREIAGSDLNDVQKALNRLVNDGKASINKSMGEPMYTRSMEPSAGAVYESFSRMFGSKLTSNQLLDSVKIKIRHRTPVDESVRGSRSRKIAAIFLEANGERFRFPHNYLPGARAMAQHIRHGGAMGDAVGSHIVESTGRLLKLREFNRYITTNRLINESSQDVVSIVQESVMQISGDLRKLAGARTYESVAARVTTGAKTDLVEDDVSTLQDMFTVRRFDERFTDVLPIVKTLLAERDQYRRDIESAASGTVFIKPGAVSTSMVLEFQSQSAKLGFQLSELSKRIVGANQLAEFVESAGSKLSRGATLDKFESAVIRQVLENVQVKADNESKPTNLKESYNLDEFFDSYIYKVL